MGMGTKLAALDNPEHAQLIDDLKDQLLIVLINRLGGNVSLPIDEVDNTGNYLCNMFIDPQDRTINLEITRKQ